MDGVSRFPNFPIEKYEISEALGQGAFGIVNSYTILHKEDTLPDKVAVKIFGKKYASSFHREKNIMEALMANNHPNIVKYYGICQLPRRGQQGLVYEVFDVDLMEYMMEKEEAGEVPLPNLETKNILYQIAKALEHMKEVKTVHRDVKPENVLLKLSKNGLNKVYVEWLLVIE